MTPAPAPGRPPDVSVIIPCYNSEATIRTCLTAVLTQQTSASFEVIVVDSSTDRTPAIVHDEFASVRLIHFGERKFAGAARNLGMPEARAPLLLMIDSDCIAEPDFIERILTRHREDHYAAVAGSVDNGTPSSLSGWIGYLLEFKEYTPRCPRRVDRNIPSGTTAYRREVFARHGVYDSDMWLGEDTLLHWRFHRAGERFLFDPSIRATHLNRTGWRRVLSYQRHHGRYSARARRRGGLPGSFLLRYPVFIVLMPFVRTVNAFSWFVKYDRRTLIAFLWAWPLYFTGATFWSWGFLQEVLCDDARPQSAAER